MGLHQRNKGKRGELEWSKELTYNGFPARRGRQYSGSPDSPDVVCKSLEHLHFEVKRVEKLNLQAAYDKAQEDAGGCQHPIVAHRRDAKPWMVTMSAASFFHLLKYGCT